MEEKKDRRFYLILLAVALVSVLITCVSVWLTRPSLTDPAILVWDVTKDLAESREKININSATVEQLAYAEGVGETTARKIYDFLRENGPITELAQLDEVDGIGEKRLLELEKIFYAG